MKTEIVTAQNRKLASTEIDLLSQLRKLPSEKIDAGLRQETSSERELLSKIVCYIYEVDRRKLYLRYNCTSLFEYLTKEMKYSAGSAQRRLDAARLLGDAPEVVESLACGELTLSQVSIVAHGLKQAKREASTNGVQFTSTVEVKRELLAKVKSQPTAQAQQIVAKALNLEIKSFEKKVVQRDESLRLEITLSKEETELLNEVKDLFSHSHPGASYKEVLVASLKDVKKRKGSAPKLSVKKLEPKVVEVKGPASVKASAEIKLSIAEVRRSVFRNDKSCRWEFANGQKCRSTFQLQIDHKKSQWLGGSGERENLQLLCAAHNRLKYQAEIGMV